MKGGVGATRTEQGKADGTRCFRKGLEIFHLSLVAPGPSLLQKAITTFIVLQNTQPFEA